MRKPPRRYLFKISEELSEGWNVVLNWSGSPSNHLRLTAEKYHRAAKLLADEFTSRRVSNDLESCPIVFLYRHAVELMFKAILTVGNKIAIAQNQPVIYTKKIYEGHGLTKHLDGIKSVFAAVGWDWSSSTLQVDQRHLENVIKEFERFDPQSHTFRYLINKRGKANIEKHFMFSPLQFARTLDPILSFLSSACFGLEIMFAEMMESMGHPARMTLANASPPP